MAPPRCYQPSQCLSQCHCGEPPSRVLKSLEPYRLPLCTPVLSPNEKGDAHLMCPQELRLFMLPTLESLGAGGLQQVRLPPTKKTLVEPKCSPWGILSRQSDQQ